MNKPALTIDFSMRWAFRLSVASLPLTTIKLFDIQLSEICAAIVICLAWSQGLFNPHTQGGKFHAIQKYGYLTRVYLLILFVFALYDTWSLVPPEFIGAGILKRPYWISASRIIELFLATHLMIVFMLNIVAFYDLSRWAAALYSQIGFWVCAYGILNYFLCGYGLEIPLWGKPSYVGFPRAQGTFVEPGPFGLFVLSLLMLETIRVRMGEKIDSLKWIFFTLALLLSVSKAGLMALCLSAPLGIYYAGRSRKRAALLVIIFFAVPIGAFYIVQDYIQIISQIDYSLGHELNGRMMAFAAIPRMLSLSPWLGVGIGNYPLMRNSPAILQGLSPSPIWDLHGAGLLGVAAEMGIPLFLAFLGLILWPIINAQRLTRDPIIKTALLFPFLAFTVGLQIHFIYPWVYLAITCGLVATTKSDKDFHETHTK